SPALVKRFALEGARQGWRMFVMYGQTEASPRISYLPPERAAQHPDAIGIAIPGGTLRLLDDGGREILEADERGELVYRGPNGMIGYASGAGGLATAERIEELRTGDVACRNADGLYYVVGRRSRFIKPFGIRLSLDDVQSHLEQLGVRCRVAGSDA